jgi:hypothetical protein
VRLLGILPIPECVGIEKNTSPAFALLIDQGRLLREVDKRGRVSLRDLVRIRDVLFGLRAPNRLSGHALREVKNRLFVGSWALILENFGGRF